MIIETHKNCGHIVERKDIPCPQNIPGCAVRHFKFTCRKCEVVNPSSVETITLHDLAIFDPAEKWRWEKI